MGTPDIPDVSIIIPARNAEHTLPRVLRGLAAQRNAPFSREVLVVDHGSTDGTAACVEACGFAQLLRAPEARTSYAVRNHGLARARGEILAFLDADCIPQPDWLARGLEPLHQHRAQLVFLEER